jgi:Flp pilus assembly pilin Flp
MSFLRNGKGASVAEYGILASLTAIAGISVALNFGATNKDTFDGFATMIAENVLG